MRRFLILLAALALSLPVAAHAATVSMGGLDCGLATHGSEEGQGEQTGVMFGGPVVVTVDGAPADAVLRCTIQQGTPDLGAAPPSAQVFGVGPGVVTIPPTGVNFTMRPDADRRLFLCMEVLVLGHTWYRYDYDPTRSGVQCGETAHSTVGGPTYVDPSTLWGEYCVLVNDPTGPPWDLCVG